MRSQAGIAVGLVIALVASFVRAEDAAPGATLARYGSMPKGVTLEGRAEGLHKARSAEYAPEGNALVLNGDTVYPLPVTRDEMIQVLNALASDDRIGVSFTPKKSVITYGQLDKDSSLVKDLVAADRFLGGVTFAIEPLYRDITLPGDFRPRAVANREIVTGSYYNLKDYTFKIENGKAALTGWTLEILLFPVSEMKSSDGGYMPDLEKMRTGVLEEEDRYNANHIRQNVREYAKLPLVAKAVKIGEAAAVARTLRDAELIDLNVLLKQMKGQIPSASLPEASTDTPSATGDAADTTATETGDAAPAETAAEDNTQAGTVATDPLVTEEEVVTPVETPEAVEAVVKDGAEAVEEIVEDAGDGLPVTTEETLPVKPLTAEEVDEGRVTEDEAVTAVPDVNPRDVKTPEIESSAVDPLGTGVIPPRPGQVKEPVVEEAEVAEPIPSMPGSDAMTTSEDDIEESIGGDGIRIESVLVAPPGDRLPGTPVPGEEEEDVPGEPVVTAPVVETETVRTPTVNTGSRPSNAPDPSEAVRTQPVSDKESPEKDPVDDIPTLPHALTPDEVLDD